MAKPNEKHRRMIRPKDRLNILVSGAGIAGLTVAALLKRAGQDVTLIEKSAEPRGAGYMIDFFGPGYDVAEQMDLLRILETIHVSIATFDFVDARGRIKASLDYPTFRRQVFADRHFNFLRGDLEDVLLRRANDNGVQPCFGRTVTSIASTRDRLAVTFSNGSTETFDAVIGADGVHSGIRSLAFGPPETFTRFLNCVAAAYVVPDASFVADIGRRFATASVPNRQAAVYPITRDKAATFFLHRVDAKHERDWSASACSELRREYADFGWLVPRALTWCGVEDRPYYDAVTQIEMPRWSSGRVVLVGDACSAVSLLAGQGASLAMAGAASLARALNACGRDVPQAFASYEASMRPVVERKQRSGRRLAAWFLPATQLGLSARDTMLRLIRLPGMMHLLGKRIVG